MHHNLSTTALAVRAFRFVPVSGNAKTGPIAVTSTAAQSCPDACPLKTTNEGGCYAAAGRSAIHWRALSEGNAKAAIDAEGLFARIRTIPRGALWRHNEAGDLIGSSDGAIDEGFVSGLVAANKGRRGFTYTHHSLNPHNVALLRQANEGGFAINISSNNLRHADQCSDIAPGLPLVTLVPEEQWEGGNTTNTPGGRAVVRCPAEYREGFTCAQCGICAVATRKAIVGFTPHGVAKRKVITIAKG